MLHGGIACLYGGSGNLCLHSSPDSAVAALASVTNVGAIPQKRRFLRVGHVPAGRRRLFVFIRMQFRLLSIKRMMPLCSALFPHLNHDFMAAGKSRISLFTCCASGRGAGF